MTQHEILMLISAPLLVLGRPLIAFLWALPPAWRETAARLGRSRIFQESLGLRFGAALGMVGVRTGIVDLASSLAIRSNTAQRLDSRGATYDFPGDSADLLVASGESNFRAGLWRRRWSTSSRPFCIPACWERLLTFAPRPWYSSYVMTAPAWHLTALEDQQIGGLIMWIPAGTLLLIVALVLLVKWMKESQTRWQYTRMAELGPLVGREVSSENDADSRCRLFSSGCRWRVIA